MNAVEKNKVWMGEEFMEADIICVCSGADFETLYPEKFTDLNNQMQTANDAVCNTADAILK